MPKEREHERPGQPIFSSSKYKHSYIWMYFLKQNDWFWWLWNSILKSFFLQNSLKNATVFVFWVLSYFFSLHNAVIHIAITSIFKTLRKQMSQVCNCTNNHDLSMILREKKTKITHCFAFLRVQAVYCL